MLLPKKVKHRKWFKGRRRNKGVATSKITIAFGSFGLRSQEYGWLSSRQLESARRAMTRFVARGGKIWIRVFPDKPVTKKGSEVPMGAGKGSVDHYVAIVRPGTILFEIDGVADAIARQALTLASYKLPVKTKLVKKHAA